jgi:lipid A disaccharide synthetase
VERAEAIARWILATPFVSLPNIVTEREVMKEALLGDATPDRLASLVSELLTDAEVRQRQVSRRWWSPPPPELNDSFRW